MPQPQKIDVASYMEGRVAFNQGKSIKDVVEAVMAKGNVDELDDVKTFSLAMGFADAVFDKLRGIVR